MLVYGSGSEGTCTHREKRCVRSVAGTGGLEKPKNQQQNKTTKPQTRMIMNKLACTPLPPPPTIPPPICHIVPPFNGCSVLPYVSSAAQGDRWEGFLLWWRRNKALFVCVYTLARCLLRVRHASSPPSLLRSLRMTAPWPCFGKADEGVKERDGGEREEEKVSACSL